MGQYVEQVTGEENISHTEEGYFLSETLKTQVSQSDNYDDLTG